MTKREDRAVARKMSRLRMFDIACSMKAAGRAVTTKMELSNGHDEYAYLGSASDVEWLMTACNEWQDYVNETMKELGIDVEG